VVRPRQPLPKDLPSIWKEHEIMASMEQSASEEEYTRPPLRIRGGVDSNNVSLSSLASPMEIAEEHKGQLNTEQINTDIIEHILTPGGALVRKHGEGSQDIESLRDSDFDTDEETGGIRVKKRKKDSDTLHAAKTVNPGIRQDKALEYGRQVRRLGAWLNEIITEETAKKKIAVAVIKDIQNMKKEYQELVEELVSENALLLSRLWEARASDKARGNKAKQTEHSVKIR